MHQDQAPAAAHRVQVLPDDAGRGRHPSDQVVRLRGRLQRHGHGAAGAKSRRSLQLLVRIVFLFGVFWEMARTYKWQ